MLREVTAGIRQEYSQMKKRGKRHSLEQIVKKLRDANAILNSGKDLSVVFQTLEVSEATLHRWRAQCGEAAKRLE